MNTGSIVIDLLLKTGSFETDSKKAQARIKGMETAFTGAAKIVDIIVAVKNGVKSIGQAVGMLMIDIDLLVLPVVLLTLSLLWKSVPSECRKSKLSIRLTGRHGLTLKRI